MRSLALPALLLLAPRIPPAATLARPAAALDASPSNGYGRALDGTPVTSLASASARAVVLFFIASDCPISNRTLPEMLRIRDEFAGDSTPKSLAANNTPAATKNPSTGRTASTSERAAASDRTDASNRKDVRFWFVYPNTTETPAGIRTHWASFGGGAAGSVLLDPSGTLTRLAGARATPEAVVLVPAPGGWKPVYAGRIDDRYVRLGLERPRITDHAAERVVRELLSNQPIERPAGALVGCGIINPGADAR